MNFPMASFSPSNRFCIPWNGLNKTIVRIKAIPAVPLYSAIFLHGKSAPSNLVYGPDGNSDKADRECYEYLAGLGADDVYQG